MVNSPRDDPIQGSSAGIPLESQQADLARLPPGTAQTTQLGMPLPEPQLGTLDPYLAEPVFPGLAAGGSRDPSLREQPRPSIGYTGALNQLRYPDLSHPLRISAKSAICIPASPEPQYAYPSYAYNTPPGCSCPRPAPQEPLEPYPNPAYGSALPHRSTPVLPPSSRLQSPNLMGDHGEPLRALSLNRQPVRSLSRGRLASNLRRRNLELEFDKKKGNEQSEGDKSVERSAKRGNSRQSQTRLETDRVHKNPSARRKHGSSSRGTERGSS